MRSLKLVTFVLSAITLGATTASAQVCLGLPSFETRQAHLNLSAEFPDSAKAYAVGVGAGRHNNLFANLGGGMVEYDGIDEKSKYGFLEFGYQLPLGKLQVCPIAGGSIAAGPDDETTGLKVTATTATAGAAVGLPLGSANLRVIPNAGVRYEWVRVKFDEPLIGETTAKSNGGIADLGFALVFRDRVSVQPVAHVPFGGEDDADPSFGVFLSVSFGWR